MMSKDPQPNDSSESLGRLIGGRVARFIPASTKSFFFGPLALTLIIPSSHQVIMFSYGMSMTYIQTYSCTDTSPFIY